jgi:hypothetical protein
LLHTEYSALYNLTDIAAVSNMEEYLLNLVFYDDVPSDFVLVVLQMWNMNLCFSLSTSIWNVYSRVLLNSKLSAIVNIISIHLCFSIQL